MNKFATLAAAIAAFGFVNAASAADMPTKMPIKAPPVIGYAWDGFYVAAMPAPHSAKPMAQLLFLVILSVRATPGSMSTITN